MTGKKPQDSAEKRPETSKQKGKPASPDTLVKTAKKSDVELNEEQLERASGGFSKIELNYRS